MLEDFRSEPDFNAIVSALTAKTLQGKIDWRETAEDEAYLTSVRGRMTFEVRRTGDRCELIAKDAEGQTLYRYATGYYQPSSPSDESLNLLLGYDPKPSPLGRLHDVARRVARRLDEKLDASLDLVNSL